MLRDFFAPVTIFDDFFGNAKPAITGFNGMFTNFPVDVKETENSYEFVMNVPGFKKEDINISVDNGVLSVKSHKEESVEKTEEDGKYIFRERSASSVKRAFKLPENTDSSKIEAKMEDGILSISIPKIEKKAESNIIEIK